MIAGYHRILVAIDFSSHSNAALRQAVRLARHTKASLTLAHALPDLRRVVHNASTQAKLDLLRGEGELFEQEVRRTSDAKMRRMVADLGELDIAVTYETLLGEPFVELSRLAESGEFDLVLAGTRGLSGWEQFIVGSTANRLIRKCPTPVWIVKADHGGPPRVVLAPTDFSDVSVKAAAHGFWIARQCQAQFHLLHVVDSYDIDEDVVVKSAEGSALRNEILDEAQNRMKTMLTTLQEDSSDVQLHVRWGTPWQEVQQVAQQVAAELIAIGTVGRSGFKGLLLGNTAEKLLGVCDCSILTVKPDDFESSI